LEEFLRIMSYFGEKIKKTWKGIKEGSGNHKSQSGRIKVCPVLREGSEVGEIE
jgi:hypothetical protein